MRKNNYNKLKYYFLVAVGRFFPDNITFDKIYLKLMYKLKMKEKINFDNPQTFNEKLQWLKIYDRNPKYTNMVDKVETKKIVENIIGKEYIIPSVAVYDNPKEIKWDELPKQFVIKCCHDSGGLAIVKNKELANKKAILKKIKKYYKRNYFYNLREWPYKNIKPKILIEKYMQDGNTNQLNDYKLMCFNGKVKCSFVCSNRNSKEGLCVNFYDRDWNPMPFERHYPKNKIEFSKPKQYANMVNLAEKLAKDIPFVRVDFYIINDKVYFGEMTFFPGSGMEEFNPVKWDYILGSWININEVKNQK